MILLGSAEWLWRELESSWFCPPCEINFGEQAISPQGGQLARPLVQRCWGEVSLLLGLRASGRVREFTCSHRNCQQPADLSLLSLAGHIPCGLICHPDKEHILYPLGCTVVIQELDSKKQTFLHGHTNNVSCIVVSRDGMYVASGQVTFMGFKVDNALFLTV